MTFNFLNNPKPATFPQGMYDWMTFMTGSPGWTCVKSGDGLSSYSSSQSVFTDTSSMNNNKAWFVLRQPNYTRQICFQRGSSDTNWRIKYSISGFSGGNASQTPSASDEQIILGSGTDSAPSMGVFFNGLTSGSFCMSSAANDSDGYAFYMFAYNSGDLRSANSIKLLFMFDAIKSGPYDMVTSSLLDTEPFAIAIANSAAYNNPIWMGSSADHSAGSPKFKGYVCKGISGRESFVNLSIAAWGIPSTNPSNNCWAPSLNQELNPHNSYEDLCPIYYFYKNSAVPASLDPAQGYKGMSGNFFMGSLQRSNGDLYNYQDPSTMDPDTSGKKIYISGFALPWNNQTPNP